MAYKRKAKVREQMTVEELQSDCGRLIGSSVGYIGDEISKDRARLWNAYFGAPYGDERDGLSAYVSSDSSDVIDQVMPDMMRLFLASGKAVRFVPTGPNDEEAAEQESDVCNHIFFQLNNSYGITHSWMMDGLVNKVGVVKCWWDERTECRKVEYKDKTAEEVEDIIASLEADGAEVEELNRWENRETITDPQTGAVLGEAVTVDVELKVEETIGGVRVECLPPEEFMISPQWTSLDLTDCPFTAHRPNNRTESDLIKQGYDPECVAEIPDSTVSNTSNERHSRFGRPSAHEPFHSDHARGNRKVTITECYIRVDWDGDGYAELLKVTMAGEQGQILKWSKGMKGKVASLLWPYDIDEVEEVPFHAWTPFMIPHKFFGESLAEKVFQLQRCNTVITRQMLDNMMHVNNPRPVVNDNAVTLSTESDLLNPGPAKPIRVDGDPSSSIVWQQVSPMIEWNLQALEHFAEKRTERTGISRANQGMSADTLNIQSGRAIDLLQQAGQGRQEMFARNFAEGMKSLFRHMHALLRRNGSQDMAVKLRGKWVQVDPTAWRHRTDLEPQVGLGSGSKDRALGGLQMVLELQEKGFDAGITDYRKMHHTMTRMIDALQLGEVDNYFIPPDEYEEMQAQTPPAEEGATEADMYMQAEQTKAQAGLMQTQTKAQADLQKAAVSDDFKRDEMRMKHAIELMKNGLPPDAAVRAVLMAESAMQALPGPQTSQVPQTSQAPMNGGAM